MIETNETQRLIAALRTSIRLSGVSYRHIERELKMSTGYLTRILAGQVQLKLVHILEVCRVIGFPASEFFTALFPRSGAESRLSKGLAQLHSEPVQSCDPGILIQTFRAWLDQLETSMKSEQS